MKIIRRFRTNTKLDITTTGGTSVVINRNTIGLELDCNTKAFFTRGAEQFYTFMQNPNYYHPNEIRFINILRDKNSIVDTVDDAEYEGQRIYTITLFNGVVFLMFDEIEES